MATSLALTGAAYAGCGGQLYCGSSTSVHSSTTGQSTLPPLSSYYSHTGSHSGSSTVVSSGSYSTTGISSSYTLPSSTISASGSTSGLSLGAGETLNPTNCSVNVDAPEGSRVLGCYTIGSTQPAAPIATTQYYRVVRPVVYVRYPVPVPVPYTVNVPAYAPCGASFGGSSRYGYGGGYSQGGSRYGSSYGFSHGGCR